MSRVGKQPIKIPSGVTVKLNGTILEVNGSKGTMKRDTFGRIAIVQLSNEIIVSAINGETALRIGGFTELFFLIWFKEFLLVSVNLLKFKVQDTVRAWRVRF